MRTVIAVLLIRLSWLLKRLVLRHVLEYDIAPSARISFSLVIGDHVVLPPGASIKHLNVIRVGLLHMEADSAIGNLNTMQGAGNAGPYFKHQADRRAELTLGAQSTITSRHYVDCTNRVNIGDFTIVAGVRTTILTHGIDLRRNRQDSGPVKIGDYCFIGTDCTVLKGAELPSRSILGAKALLNKAFNELGLYAGVPAERRPGLDETAPLGTSTDEDSPNRHSSHDHPQLLRRRLPRKRRNGTRRCPHDPPERGGPRTRSRASHGRAHARLIKRLALASGGGARPVFDVVGTVPFYGHIREYTAHELKTMLRRVGFENICARISNRTMRYGMRGRSPAIRLVILAYLAAWAVYPNWRARVLV
jgi:acetyltransferase-like isoleucine patch superfamily enzyme